MFNRWITNYDQLSKKKHDAFRQLSWLEWFIRLFRKPFIQTITTYKNGMTVISGDNPHPSKRRTKKVLKKEK